MFGARRVQWSLTTAVLSGCSVYHELTIRAVCAFVSSQDASASEIYDLIEATVKKKKPALGGHGSMYGIAKSDNRSMILIGG